jgi:hypothetical protein
MKYKPKVVIGQQYLEVVSKTDGTWSVELVIESMLNTYWSPKRSLPILRYSLNNFESMLDGDRFADGRRFIYDKIIFKHDLV